MTEQNYRLSNEAGVIWFTGLSGAGKSTLAEFTKSYLDSEGFVCLKLDGDEIRSGINKGLSFSREDRKENVRRVAEMARFIRNQGIMVVVALIAPYEADRQMAKEIIGREHFYEIYMNTPMKVCEQRDVKKLYRRARTGEIKKFTGVSDGYEPPVSPDLVIDTSVNDLATCQRMIEEMVRTRIL